MVTARINYKFGRPGRREATDLRELISIQLRKAGLAPAFLFEDMAARHCHLLPSIRLQNKPLMICGGGLEIAARSSYVPSFTPIGVRSRSSRRCAPER